MDLDVLANLAWAEAVMYESRAVTERGFPVGSSLVAIRELGFDGDLWRSCLIGVCLPQEPPAPKEGADEKTKAGAGAVRTGDWGRSNWGP